MERRSYVGGKSTGRFNQQLRDRISSEEDFVRIFEISATTTYHHANHTLSLYSPGGLHFIISAYGKNNESESEVLDSVEERFSLIKAPALKKPRPTELIYEI